MENLAALESESNTPVVSPDLGTVEHHPATELAPAGINIVLRPYQQEGMDEVRQAFASRQPDGTFTRAVLLVAPTGGGKGTLATYALAAAAAKGSRSLFIVHRREIIRDVYRRLRKVNAPCTMILAGEPNDPYSPIQVCSVQTLTALLNKKKQLPPAEFIFWDECFPAGTLVDGRPIETVREGDLVRSFDHAMGQVVLRRVTHRFVSKPHAMVRVTLEDGQSVACTAGHPWFVRGRGYVAAGKLQPGEEVVRYAESEGLRGLRDAVRAAKLEQQDGSDLLGAVQGAASQGPRPESDRALQGLRRECRGERPTPAHREDGRVLLHAGAPGTLGVAAFFGAHDPNQPGSVGAPCVQDGAVESYALGGHPGESRPSTENVEASSGGTWGQRQRTVGCASAAGRNSRTVVDVGAVGWDRKGWQGERASDALQTRPREPGSDGRDRGRRPESWTAHPGGAGSQKGRVSGVARVARVEVLERGGDGTFGGVCPDGLVYNLEVDVSHTYFANDVLVHNCHHCVAKTYRQIREWYPNAKHLGASIGPDSWCEFVGGPFGDGWVGRMEDAYAMASAAYPVSTEDGVDTVSCDGVLSRGWLGDRFGWKPVRTFLRHACTTETSTLSFRGQDLVATNDHSIFEITKKGLVETRTDDLTKGSVLAYDDGRDWTVGVEPIWDMAALVPRCHVVVALDKVSASDLHATPGEWYSWRRRVHGPGLSYGHYLRHKDILPRPSRVYTEGATGNWSAPEVRLSDLAYLVGVFIGNGWLDRARMSLSIRNDRVPDLLDYIAKLQAMRVSAHASKTRSGATEVRCGNRFLIALLVRLFGGQDAPRKRIPAWILTTWSEAARRELLRGLLDTDGHTKSDEEDRERGQYTTTSRGLAHDVLCLLRSLGVTGGLTETPPSLGGVIKGRQIVGNETKFDVSWSMHPLAGDSEGHRGLRSRFHLEGTHEVLATSVTPCPPPRHVYDLSMDGHPSFVSHGVLVHNSATPMRADRSALGDVFQEMLVIAKTSELIAQNYLVPCATFSPDRHLGSNLAQDPLDAYLDHGEGKRGFVFVDRKTIAKQVAQRFNEAGVTAVAIDAHTPDQMRKRQIELFAEGHIRIVVNVATMTEGVDVPQAKVCILASNTATPAAYLQKAGRVLRLAEGEGHAILIDLCGNMHLHGLPTDDREFSLTGKPITNAEPKDDKIFPCPHNCGAMVRAFHIADSGPGCPSCGWKKEPRPMAEILGEKLHVYGEQLPLNFGVDA